MSPPLSQSLRDGTREVHERIETGAAFNRRIVIRLPAGTPGVEDPQLAQAREEYRETYRHFLIASLGFESAVDVALASSPALTQALQLGYEHEAGSPAAQIRADLEQVFAERMHTQRSTMTALAVPATLAELAGLEYVRRGSRAGGAVIGAIVRANLGLTREQGASFLLHHGKQTRSIIDDYKRWLDGLVLEPADRHAAVAAAARVFECVGAWHTQVEAQFAQA